MRILSLLLAATLVACSSEDTTTPPTDSDRDGDGIVDDRDRCPDDAEDIDGFQDSDGCPDPGNHQGSLPDVPEQSGVVYVAHYATTELRIYRTDGTEPYQELSFDLGVESHDLALDPANDLLAVTSDVGKSMNLYAVHRPSGPSDAVLPPTHQAEIIYDNVALYVRFHPVRNRLYVVTSTPGEPPLANYLLFAYDISEPTSPAELAGSPFTIPLTSTFAIDHGRDLLFLVDYKSKDLLGYDLSGDGLDPLAGDPVSLETLYPQSNSWGFQVLSLTVDPWRHRLVAARHQGALSELIALSYAEAVPFPGTSYTGGMSDLTLIADGFDVDVHSDSRPNLLGAYQPAIDFDTGAVFLTADAWNGTVASGILAPMNEDLTLASACDAFEGFGCWLRYTSGSTPGGYLPTEGASCVDSAHGVVVTTSYNGSDGTAPGAAHFFTYDSALAMSEWLPTSGTTLPAGGSPIAAVCH